MAAVNQVGNSLTGLTGTGSFVGANTPTLITPVLGAATATSINFGGGALSAYVPVTAWTPSMTFATPGDLTLASVTAVAFYQTVGSISFVNFTYFFTPTYTTASGAFRLTGIPFTSFAQGSMGACATNMTFSAGMTNVALYCPSGNNYIQIFQSGSAASVTEATTANFPSGVNHRVYGSVAIFRGV